MAIDVQGEGEWLWMFRERASGYRCSGRVLESGYRCSGRVLESGYRCSGRERVAIDVQGESEWHARQRAARVACPLLRANGMPAS